RRERETGMTQAAAHPEDRGFVNRMLDTIEKIGNKVPSPVMMFLYLIIGVVILSAILDIANVKITEEVIVTPPEQVEQYYVGETVGPALHPVIATEDEGYILTDPEYIDD